MFKSYFASGWFRKPTPSPSSPEKINSSFVVPGRDTSHLYQVSMKEGTEEFVDINCRKLSYAEVASMSKDEKQTSKVPMAVPKKHRVDQNQYEVLADDDDELTGSVYLAPEKFKSNNYFFKNKVYKDADKAKNKKLKKKAAKK